MKVSSAIEMREAANRRMEKRAELAARQWREEVGVYVNERGKIRGKNRMSYVQPAKLEKSVPLKLTWPEIEACKSSKGGWTAKQLREWGVPWPPPHGWLKALLAGKPIPPPVGYGGRKKAQAAKAELVPLSWERGEGGPPSLSDYRGATQGDLF